MTQTVRGGGDKIEVVDKKGSAGDYTSLELSPSTGLPVIAYSDNGKLSVVRCNDVNCSGGDEPENKVDTSVSNAHYISIALDNNEYPAVSYFDPAPRYDLKILRCNDVSCLGDDESIVTIDTLGGESTSIQVDSFGNPIVSYIANDKLKILHCNDINCVGGDESIIEVDDAHPEANISGTSLQLDNFGNPVVGYYDDVNDDLKILHCDDPNCDDNVSTVFVFASGTEDIHLDNATYTRWFSVENVMRDSNGVIVDTGGTEDPSTQKVTVHVTWPFFGDTAEVTIVEYLTRTKNEVTIFTDWSGGFGVEGPTIESDRTYSTSTGIDALVSGKISLYEGDCDPGVIFCDDFTGTNGSNWDAEEWEDDDINGGLHDIQSSEGHLQTAVTDDSGARARAIGSVHNDAELLVKWRKDAINPAEPDWGLRFWLRASNNWPNPDCTPDPEPGNEACEGYAVLMQAGKVYLYSYTSSLQSELANISYADDTSWHWLRFRVEGNQLKVRVWADGASETGAWDMEVADSSLTSGVLQVNAWSKVATVYNWYIDDLTLTNISGGGGGSSANGSLISATFDTLSPQGTQINSIFWQGMFGTGGANSVKLQIASANCANGATDAPNCATNIGWGGSKTSGDGAFIGFDGTSSTFYEPSDPGIAYTMPLDQHNNVRYYRYKVYLDKDTGATSPVVEDVIINWSP